MLWSEDLRTSHWSPISKNNDPVAASTVAHVSIENKANYMYSSKTIKGCFLVRKHTTKESSQKWKGREKETLPCSIDRTPNSSTHFTAFAVYACEQTYVPACSASSTTAFISSAENWDPQPKPSFLSLPTKSMQKANTKIIAKKRK